MEDVVTSSCLTKISQERIRTHLRCAVIFSDVFFGNLLLNLTVKKYKNLSVFAEVVDESIVAIFYLRGPLIVNGTSVLQFILCAILIKHSGWYMLTRHHTVLRATHTFIHKWNKPHLPSQTQAAERHCTLAGTHFLSH